MKLLLTKKERIQYMGFDDRLMMLVFIPFLGVVSFLLFTAGRPELSKQSPLLCFSIGLSYTLLYWTINRYWIIWLRMRLPKLTQTRERVIKMVVFSAAIVVLSELASNIVLRKLLPSIFDQPWNDSGFAFDFVASFVLCAMVIAIYESLYFFSKYSQSLVEREKLAKANMHAQLAALKQQVNPHFLFNSLNTLANVIPENPQLATRFVQRLAAVYRRVLEYRHKELVSLEEELKALEDYLFLLKTRFENKFGVQLLLEESDECFMLGESKDLPFSFSMADKNLPPLVLQLLVENAVKHNVVSTAEPLLVVIKVARGMVSVSNRLNRRPYKLDSMGLGLENIHKRYALLTSRKVAVTETQDQYEVILPLLNNIQSQQYATA